MFDSFWPGLGLQSLKAIVVISKLKHLPNHLRERRLKRRSFAFHHGTKIPLKITMYLGLDILIKLRFTKIFIAVGY